MDLRLLRNADCSYQTQSFGKTVNVAKQHTKVFFKTQDFRHSVLSFPQDEDFQLIYDQNIIDLAPLPRTGEKNTLKRITKPIGFKANFGKFSSKSALKRFCVGLKERDFDKNGSLRKIVRTGLKRADCLDHVDGALGKNFEVIKNNLELFLEGGKEETRGKTDHWKQTKASNIVKGVLKITLDDLINLKQEEFDSKVSELDDFISSRLGQ